MQRSAVDELKRRALGGSAGPTLLRLRNWAALRSIPFRNPESAAAIANDILCDKLIGRLCAPGGTFLDVGAHIGSVVARVKSGAPGAKVIAVEADPRKAADLAARHPDVRVLSAAASDRTGRARFHVPTGATGYASLHETGRNGESFEVDLHPLDDLVPTDAVDVVKLDVEGAELAALRGAARLIARARPTVMFESVGASAGSRTAGLWCVFDSFGYDVFTPDRLAHDAPPLTLEAFLDAHAYPRRTHNYFAVARERRIELRDKARCILRISVSGPAPAAAAAPPLER